MFAAACKRIDSGQCYRVPVPYIETKTSHQNQSSLLWSDERPGGVHKIRKTLQRITLPRNMEYEYGSIDKGRKVALDPLLKQRTGGVAYSEGLSKYTENEMFVLLAFPFW